MLKRMAFVGLLAVICAHSNAQVIYSNGFSKAEGYIDGTVIDQPAGAANLWEDSPADTPDGFFMIENETLVVTQVDTSDHWIFINFPKQTAGVFTVTWDWQYVGPVDGNIDVGFCISTRSNFDFDGNPELGWPEQGVMSRMQEGGGGVVDCRNGDWVGGGSYQAFQVFPYTDGKKISMRYVIDVDVSDQLFSCYAQKEGEDEVQLAEDFGFRRETYPDEGLNVISIWMSGNTVGTQCIIDNIVIFGPAPITEWPLY
ncbi:MAG: hypothetical protein AB1656_17215 [Candidatus Omnitrophota bacterium]